MPFLVQATFELTGMFEGFARNAEGKRRMLLRLSGGDVIELKVPKEIRKEFSDRLCPGAEVSVSGIEKRKLFRAVKRIVSQLRILSDIGGQRRVCAKCPIRVCSKKNCWKQGGKELWKYLEKRIEEEGLSEIVELKDVGCLKNCDYAPNICYNRKVRGECSKQDADAILAEIVSKYRPVESGAKPH